MLVGDLRPGDLIIKVDGTVDKVLNNETKKGPVTHYTERSGHRKKDINRKEYGLLDFYVPDEPPIP